MKKCRDCHKLKSLTEFYRQKEMKDGHLNKCKSCVLSRTSKYREENLEKIQAKDRKRGRTKERLAYQRKLGEKFRTRRSHYAVAWSEKNPEKRKAQNIANGHIYRGTLKKNPCEVCGRKKVEAHHDDYSKPLEVRWLCRKHHAEIHRKY